MDILFPANRLAVQVEDAMASLVLDAVLQVADALVSFFVCCTGYRIETKCLEQRSHGPDLIDVEALGLLHPLCAHRCCTVAVLFLVSDIMLNDRRVSSNGI